LAGRSKNEIQCEAIQVALGSQLVCPEAIVLESTLETLVILTKVQGTVKKINATILKWYTPDE